MVGVLALVEKVVVVVKVGVVIVLAVDVLFVVVVAVIWGVVMAGLVVAVFFVGVRIFFMSRVVASEIVVNGVLVVLLAIMGKVILGVVEAVGAITEV